MARRLFSTPFVQRSREMAHPVLTKAFLQLIPEAAMLFAPFGCTNPPPPVPPAQNHNTLYQVTSQAENCMTHICIYCV